VRIIIFISSLFPISAGIFFLVNEGQTFVALAFIAGVALSALGLSEIPAYFVARRRLGLPSWMLAESLLALLLSAVTLQNRIIDDDVALAVYGVWLAAAGVMRVAGAMDMSKEKPIFRVALCVVGLLSAAMGVYGFFRPFLPELGMTGILGGIFIMQGVAVFTVGAGISRKRTDNSSVNPAEMRTGAESENAARRSAKSKKSKKGRKVSDEKTTATD
jgi:uncharacterized membrane protein HdeD (DUF308 family)